MDITPRNEVLLVGRLAAEPLARVLPSGDALVTFRLVIDRPPPRKSREGVRTPSVDTLDCSAWTATLQRTAASWVGGDMVEVEGALRRRFWRAGAGVGSRCEVEVSRARRVARAER